MRKTMIVTLVLVLTALASVTTATAATTHRGAPFFTTLEAEDAAFASSWAKKQKIEDIVCHPLKPADSTNADKYKHFFCKGEVTRVLYGDPFLCTFPVLAHTLPVTAKEPMAVFGTNSSCKLAREDEDVDGE
jgi:hypothetical protein